MLATFSISTVDSCKKYTSYTHSNIHYIIIYLYNNILIIKFKYSFIKFIAMYMPSTRLIVLLCGGQHRVHHSCGNRHCPQCQQHKTQQWLHHHLDTQLPGPHFLITFTVPETLRPFLRSHQRLAYHAMFHASALALKRLAKDERFIGTDLPGFPGVLHTWGRPTAVPPSHPLPCARWWPLRGPHDMGALPRPLLCPRQSPLPHLPCHLQRRDAPSRTAGAPSPPTCGPSPGTSTVRPILTDTPPSPPLPRMSSGSPSPIAAS